MSASPLTDDLNKHSIFDPSGEQAANLGAVSGFVQVQG
jgi:hypothetical protein